MSTKLFYRDRPLFGLEVSQTGLRAMALDKKWHVLGYGSIDLDPTKLEESLTKHTSFLSEGISSLLSHKIVGHLPTDRVAVSVPTARAFNRSLILPTSAESDLLEAVQLEAEQYIPLPQSELYIDFEIIKRHKDTLEVLLSAIPKRLVDTLVQACHQANLQPILIEPSMLSLIRLSNLLEEGHLPTIIVDIGAASSDIAVYDTSIRVTGSAPVGGHSLTLTLSKKLNLSLAEAHKLKVMSGLSIGPKQDKIREALAPQLNEIVMQIRKISRYYTERIGNKIKIEQVIIVGSGSNVPGLGDYFTESLLMPSRIGSPWQALHFGHLKQPSPAFRARYITATGLALARPEAIWA
jgi:type IV pilus assembly protein PilM